ncbi:MAG: hypothetical protein ABJN14_16275 [Paracoccaceae bacterium]
MIVSRPPQFPTLDTSMAAKQVAHKTVDPGSLFVLGDLDSERIFALEFAGPSKTAPNQR